jgi:catechol 2,3-dioxygenase-like lactoylglutathione lyase family enzyme
MTIPARLTIVTLGARDLPVLRSFYRSLGWSEGPASEDTWASFMLGGVVFALYPLPDLAAEAAPGAPDPAGGWSGVTLSCNVDTREEVDRVFAAFVAAGATAVAEPIDRAWGGRSGYVADPEGNRWEIGWARGAVFDERGAVVSFG